MNGPGKNHREQSRTKKPGQTDQACTRPLQLPLTVRANLLGHQRLEGWRTDTPQSNDRYASPEQNVPGGASKDREPHDATDQTQQQGIPLAKSSHSTPNQRASDEGGANTDRSERQSNGPLAPAVTESSVEYRRLKEEPDEPRNSAELAPARASNPGRERRSSKEPIGLARFQAKLVRLLSGRDSGRTMRP